MKILFFLLIPISCFSQKQETPAQTQARISRMHSLKPHEKVFLKQATIWVEVNPVIPGKPITEKNFSGWVEIDSSNFQPTGNYFYADKKSKAINVSRYQEKK